MSNVQLTMTDLHQKYTRLGSDEIILDVRTPDEFRAGHIPGSINISFDQLGKHVEKLREYHHIYLHCQAGRRASVAAETLNGLGFKNISCVSGSGMADWIEAGFPIEK